jgi:cytoskeletal protein CcmA (bactofilin family)
MKGKRFGMAVFLSVSLFFLACPTDSDSEGNGDDTSKDANDLANALNALGTGNATIDSNGNVKLVKPVELNENVEVGAAATLIVPNDTSLTVMTGTTLNVKGTVSVAAGGTFLVSMIEQQSPVDPNPSELSTIFMQQITTTQNTELAQSEASVGRFAIESNGKIEIAQNALLGNGSTSVYYVNSSSNEPTCQNSTFLYEWDEGTMNGKITLKANNAIELEGFLTAVDNTETNAEIATGTVTIAANGKLTIPSVEEKSFGIAGTVNVAGTLEVKGTVNVTGTINVMRTGTLIAPPPGVPSAMVIVTNGKIEVAQGATLAYDISSASIYFVGGGAESAPLYKWDNDSQNGKITLKPGNLTELEAGRLSVENDTGVAAGSIVTINAGGRLTIPEGKTLTVGGTLEVKGALTVNGTLTLGGKLVVKGDLIVNGTLAKMKGSSFIKEKSGSFIANGEITEIDEST